jgi:hypothetical protein
MSSKKMDIIKKNLAVIIIVLTLLVLVLFRSTGINHFSSNAKSHAESSMTQTNTITTEKFGSLAGDKLLVNLGGDISSLTEDPKEKINVSPDSILMKNQVKKIMKHDGPVVLYSSEPAIAARIWMLLSQMGCKNVYILENTTDNEVLKYKFHPDSLSQTKLTESN